MSSDKDDQFSPEVLNEAIGGTPLLRKEISIDDVNSLRRSYQDLEQEAGDTWPRRKLEIARRIGLRPKRIQAFIEDDGTFYGDSISKLASNFNKVNLKIRTPEEIVSVLDVKYIHFAEVYKRSDLPALEQKIRNTFQLLRKAKGNIEKIKETTKNVPEERIQIEKKIKHLVSDLTEKLEKETITLLSGVLPRFLSPFDADASIVVAVFFDKTTLMKETHKTVRPGTKPEDLKYSFTTKGLDKEKFENIQADFDNQRPEKPSLNVPYLENQESDFNENELCHYLNQGFVIAYPTEGVWGLGCNPMDEDAVNRLCKLKERNIDEGLILVSSNQDHLAKFLFGLEYKLIKKAHSKWPGPHTWVVPANPEVPKWIKGMHETVALRWSDHSTIARITSAFGGPICSTSANIRGQKAAKTKQEVKDIFGEKVYFVDGDLGDSQGATSMQNLETDEWLR
tara:strand:- start:48 stop:1403 length:1356 start_codon:yes stop_codon:yes gene_type:complete